MWSGAWWTKEKEALLREYHDRGLSYSMIGSLLGFTRNAISGKCWRLDLPKRFEAHWYSTARAGTKRKPYKKRQKEPTKREKVTFKPLPIIEPITADPVVVVPLEALRYDSCRYPIGDPRDPGFGFCGHVKEWDHAYCLYHRRIASKHE